MSGEIVAILAVGGGRAGIILTGNYALRGDVTELRERMAHLQGLLEGLREAITVREASGS